MASEACLDIATTEPSRESNDDPECERIFNPFREPAAMSSRPDGVGTIAGTSNRGRLRPVHRDTDDIRAGQSQEAIRGAGLARPTSLDSHCSEAISSHATRSTKWMVLSRRKPPETSMYPCLRGKSTTCRRSAVWPARKPGITTERCSLCCARCPDPSQIHELMRGYVAGQEMRPFEVPSRRRFVLANRADFPRAAGREGASTVRGIQAGGRVLEHDAPGSRRPA